MADPRCHSLAWSETENHSDKKDRVVRNMTITRYDDPTLSGDSQQTHYLRCANFMLAMTRVSGRMVLSRDNPDEYMVVAPPGLQVRLEAGEQEVCGKGDDLFIVPPGASRLIVEGEGYLARIFSHCAEDLAVRAVNQHQYRSGTPQVTPLTPWPAPLEGYRLRHYRLENYVDPTLPGRAFRCSNLMVNITDVYPGQRDSRKLKPHSHQDFEQITLTCAGQFVHHLRSPWGGDSTQWQADEHLTLGSPTAISIPPGLIHTSQAMEQGCWLIDIFAPPRMDFSRVPGFVRNADEYPLPCLQE